jgi:PTH1 family peptidyl-tRNA hydrolase
MKLSFDRGSGGHKGLESVMNYVHTQKFTRIRLGVSPSTAAGSIRKPDGKKAVNDFILNKFSAAQADQLKRVFKKASDALEAIVKEGPMMAMNQFN